MPRLKKEIIEERYRIINDLYCRFSYEITQYQIDSDYRQKIRELARELRLELRKFL